MNPIPGLTAKSCGQPWALGCNAFGVESGIEAGIAGLLSRVLAETKTQLPTVSSMSSSQRAAGRLFSTQTLVLGIGIGFAIAIEARREAMTPR